MGYMYRCKWTKCNMRFETQLEVNMYHGTSRFCKKCGNKVVIVPSGVKCYPTKTIYANYIGTPMILEGVEK